MKFWLSKSDIFLDQARNETGATSTEAAVASLFLFPLIFLSLYFNLLTMRMTSAHYTIQNALRTASVGPQKGVSPREHSANFQFEVLKNLKEFADLKLAPDKVLFRNSFGCFMAYGTKEKPNLIRTFPKGKNCPEQPKEIDDYGLLIPKDFVSVEVEIKLIEGKVFGLSFPKTTVSTGMTMGAFTNE